MNHLELKRVVPFSTTCIPMSTPVIHDEFNNSSIGDKKATCLVKRGLTRDSACSVVYVFCHARLPFTSLGFCIRLNSL